MTEPSSAPLFAPRQVQWTERLSVGVEEIDAQHQELYRRINRFLGALAERRGAAELEPLARFLRDYVREHFADEQRLMEFSCYPGLGDHLAEHQHFQETYQALAAELAAAGPTFGLAKQLVGLLVDWLDTHLTTTDRAFGAYLSAQRGRRSGTPTA